MRVVYRDHRTAVLVVLGVWILLIWVGCSRSHDAPAPPSTDVGAIAAADAAYVRAWLRNDPDQVMATLTEDAVLVPSGLPVLEGAEAIRQFWFQADSPPTTVSEFTLNQKEVGGNGDFGFVRGTFTLGFEYDGDAYSNRGDYLSLLRRLPDSSWRISHRMWNDHPSQID